MAEPASTAQQLSFHELLDAWPVLSAPERLEGFRLLPQPEAEEFFLELDPHRQAELIAAMPSEQRRLWVRALPPDDAADLVQRSPPALHDEILKLLDEATRKEVTVLLAYAEDDAGGLMSPHFARARPEMTVDEAISYLRKQARDRVETIYYAYVLDHEQHLLGVVSFRDLFSAPAEKRVRDVMLTNVITVPETMDQEQVGRVFSQHHLMAIPVVDVQRHMKGIVTVDDIVDVIKEEATEDIQKIGGMEALDAPYLDVRFWTMVKKRAGWLSALFLGEMLTATAMGQFEDEIARAVVLALFVPLIISSGGNSGSQASTLVVRALALTELRLRDWWRVIRREVAAGVCLGTILGTIGLVRILVWQSLFHTYGEHYRLVAITVAASLVGVVTFGTTAGSMLPFILRRVGWDPASASAPFVATLVDVTGLVIYFTVANVVLGGTLL